MFSIQHSTFNIQHSPSEQLPLKRPPLLRHAAALHQYADVLTDPIRQNQPPRLFALFADCERLVGRSELRLVERLEELVLGGARGEQEFGLPVEKERRESVPLPHPLQIREVDVRRQVLLAGIRQQISGDLLRCVRGGRSEMTKTAREKLLLGETVIERENEAARHEPTDVFVHALPFEGNVGELAVAQLDAAISEIVATASFRLMLAPVELPLSLGDPQLVQVIAAHDEPREWKRIEKLIADDELRVAPRNVCQLRGELR